ncbi:MAG: glycosyltransferase family 4 protein [Candidatus Zixiibacteriota bacterium]
MKILFVYHKKMASFIRKDLEILKKRHEVRVVRFSTVLDAYIIWKGTQWCDLTFSWFGSLHSFFTVLFSKLLGKKSVVVAGGYDVVYLPEIKYGLFSFWWKRWCPLMIFRYADLILTVSQSTTRETLKNAKADPQKIKLVYHGFDSNIYKPVSHEKKAPIVLTVGNVNRSTLTKKGLKLFGESSRLVPEAEFILVGKWVDDSIDYLRSIASSNMRFLDQIDQSALFALMSKSKVYVQVSWHESFGCALAEAMLCECIPVVTKSAAIPEVVGDCGFFLTDHNPEELAALIKRALNTDLKLGKRARERIKTLFPLEKREKALLQIIQELKA